MATPIGIHYADVSIREDLGDVIKQITPLDCPWFNLIGDSEASAVIHQWPVRSLTTRQHNAQIEAATFSLANPVLPTRALNVSQILWKTVSVSRTQQRITHAGISDLMRDQITQRLAELKTDIEHALLLASTASGNGSTARQMNGLLNIISTNASTVASGTQLTESVFQDLIQQVWEAGGNPRHVLVNGTMKRRISTFATSVTKFEMVTDRRAIRTISVYECDLAAPLEIVLSRDIPTGSAASSVVVVDVSMFKKAWIDRAFAQMLAKTSDSIDAVVAAECTLEYGNEAAAGVLKGLS